MEIEVDSWTDGLGMPIDPEIKDTVIILNLLGLTTRASCEGHIDWGLPYPWIDFELRDKKIEELNNERQNVIKLIDKKELEIQQKHPDLSLGEALRKIDEKEIENLYSEMHRLNDIIEIQVKRKFLSQKNLLGKFYEKYPVDQDNMVIIRELGVMA